MAITGVRLQTAGQCKLFHVDNFSLGLQDELRNQLGGLFHGFSNIESLPKEYDYKMTLKLFLAKFHDKTEKTQKGMVGELLANVLINHYEKQLKCLSVLQNKEENNVKKGFDIVYYQNPPSKIWYTEVKSGAGNVAKKQTTEVYNKVLLKRSFTGISEMLGSSRDMLWSSALIDVELMVKDFKSKTEIKNLLSRDTPLLNLRTSKNAILISVLYHDLRYELQMSSVSAVAAEFVSSNPFSDFMVISIQKATYQKVVNFLKAEAK